MFIWPTYDFHHLLMSSEETKATCDAKKGDEARADITLASVGSSRDWRSRTFLSLSVSTLRSRMSTEHARCSFDCGLGVDCGCQRNKGLSKRACFICFYHSR